MYRAVSQVVEMSEEIKPTVTRSDWLIPVGVGALCGLGLVGYVGYMVFSKPLSVDNDPGIFFAVSPILFFTAFAPGFAVAFLIFLLRRCYLNKPKL